MRRTRFAIRMLHVAGLLALPVAQMCVAAGAQAQAKPTAEQVKAAYLYNFGRYVKWPPNVAADHDPGFAICVLGQDPLGLTLSAAVAGERLNGRAVTVRRIATAPEASGCRILFINADQSAHLHNLLAGLDQSAVLTVSDIPDFLEQGGMIQFVEERDTVRFKVDLAHVSSARLALSSELLRVAAAVQGSGRPGGE